MVSLKNNCKKQHIYITKNTSAKLNSNQKNNIKSKNACHCLFLGDLPLFFTPRNLHHPPPVPAGLRTRRRRDRRWHLSHFPLHAGRRVPRGAPRRRRLGGGGGGSGEVVAPEETAGLRGWMYPYLPTGAPYGKSPPKKRPYFLWKLMSYNPQESLQRTPAKYHIRGTPVLVP